MTKEWRNPKPKSEQDSHSVSVLTTVSDIRHSDFFRHWGLRHSSLPIVLDDNFPPVK